MSICLSHSKSRKDSRGGKKKKEKHIFNMMWKVACASKPCVIMKLTKS
jgi:hypothetical protein